MEAKKVLNFAFIFHLVNHTACKSISPVPGLPHIKIDSDIEHSADSNFPKYSNHKSEESEVERLRRALREKDQIIINKDQIIINKDQIIINKDRTSRNDRLICAFLKGRQINEDSFADVIRQEKAIYGEKRYKYKVKEACQALMKRDPKLPEDLSAYTDINPDTWDEIKFSYFAHWVPYFQRGISEYLAGLKKLLDKYSVKYDRYGWAMAKSFKVFCDYIHKKPKSTKLYNRPGNVTKDYLKMIKTHNQWILTEYDLFCLNVTAEITNNGKISGLEWFDESRRLAIPIIREEDPALLFECPVLKMDQAHLIRN